MSRNLATPSIACLSRAYRSDSSVRHNSQRLRLAGGDRVRVEWGVVLACLCGTRRPAAGEMQLRLSPLLPSSSSFGLRMWVEFRRCCEKGLRKCAAYSSKAGTSWTTFGRDWGRCRLRMARLRPKLGLGSGKFRDMLVDVARMSAKFGAASTVSLWRFDRFSMLRSMLGQADERTRSVARLRLVGGRS